MGHNENVTCMLLYSVGEPKLSMACILIVRVAPTKHTAAPFQAPRGRSGLLRIWVGKVCTVGAEVLRKEVI